MKDDFYHLGYETISLDELPEYHCRGIFLRHIQTGAEIYRIFAEDQENLFSFIFRTPPNNHSGVPHILEHTVLCGSRRFPLKDPFLVLLKSSANTFLNAMTYPDKTVYPASSTVKADFYNLLRVYGDAVFFPNLKPEAFEQEGHHLHLNPDGRLVRSGIVLNEMRGSYSSPESVGADCIARTIFSDTPYRWDSGGNPEHIPLLTYEIFKKFHNDYYHPSNCRIFLYGNHDMDEILTMLSRDFLGHFEQKQIESAIPLQKKWTKPVSMTAYWPSSPGEAADDDLTASFNWLWGEAANPRDFIDAQTLSYILMGNSGSPLHKALIDCNLGQDISPLSGLDSSCQQMVFTAALRGIREPNIEKMGTVIRQTLERVSDGLDDELIEGALRSVEFREREIRGGIPFGMRLMSKALRGWLYDAQPHISLQFDKHMTELRANLNAGYFERLVIRDILDNTHRCDVIVKADENLQECRDANERKELDALLKNMGPNELEGLKESNIKLKKFMQTPDSPEIMAKIPRLRLEDMPQNVDIIPLDNDRQGGVNWYSLGTLTNGVAYLKLAFDLQGLDPSLQRWMPLFARSMTDVGLPGVSFEQVSRILALNTGGLGCSLEASNVLGKKDSLSSRLFVHLKALERQWDDALDITCQLLESADYTDEKRIDDLLIELRNDYKAAIGPSGSSFASLRASCRHSAASVLEEQWYGIEQYLFLETMARTAGRSRLACQALCEIQKRVIQSDGLSLTVAADEKHLPDVLGRSLDAIGKLKSAGIVFRKSTREMTKPEPFTHPSCGESITIPSAVSYSALSLPAPVFGTPEYSKMSILAHLLRTGYLWETIRVQGGAYGAGASISSLEGTFNFTTFRDPVIVPSLAAFKKSLNWACTLTDEMIVSAVIGTVGKDLKPLSPSEKASIAFKRRLYGITDDLRQINRDTQLGMTARDISETAQGLLARWEERSISVISGSRELQKACRTLPELAESGLVLRL